MYREDAIEEKVERLSTALETLTKRVSKAEKAKPRVDMNDNKKQVLQAAAAGLTMAVVACALAWFLVENRKADLIQQSLRESNTQELTLARTAASVLRNGEELAAAHRAQQAEIVRNQETAAAEVEEATRACIAACSTFSYEVIRSSPCLCGADSMLIMFNDDYTSMTRVHEVESLVPDN